LLADSHVACLVALDTHADLRVLDAENLHRLLAESLLQTAADLPLSPALRTQSSSPLALVRDAVAEVARVAGKPVIFVVDGLEKLPRDSRLFEALTEATVGASLVTVLPWHAAFAPDGEPIAESLPLSLRAFDVEDEADAAALRELVQVRLTAGGGDAATLPETLLELVVQQSGGLPRTLLQLLGESFVLARVGRGEGAAVELEDVVEACRAQSDSFRRRLQPGDLGAMRFVRQTDGREMVVERRVRLLTQGLLLERLRNDTLTVEIHPLVAPFLDAPGSRFRNEYD
jgi:hypothetical protein